ncbi:MAG: ferredoxin [Nocardioidaceae bacterium]|nr:ferredoxin [Nocardioidaceae bacterium]
MRALADLELCQGHQSCQFEAPLVFGYDDETDKVTVLDEHPPETERDNLVRAVRYCPAMALGMED